MGSYGCAEGVVELVNKREQSYKSEFSSSANTKTLSTYNSTAIHAKVVEGFILMERKLPFVVAYIYICPIECYVALIHIM
ncbi:unnamed protein product [Colletotrichum noveboracense]|uniref:Uncharacterized protein n=1 Tax=Colletotrichum noveboracense TaxID=2664923 RepID=A0A9W4WCJ9_9PEZI|nr:unnamed protein product [Colletotrichum noveboracense]